MVDLDAVVAEFKDGFDVATEKAKLQSEFEKVKASLEFITNFEVSVDSFVEGIRNVYGDSLTSDVLLQNLQARFGGGSNGPKRKRAVKAEVASDDGNEENYQKVLSVLTKEPMTFGEITKFLGEDVPRPKVSEALLYAIKKGVVNSDGKYKGKRYFLAEDVA